ncbi:hypothetical protein WA026_015005 [Henosepilachna vigintioctopunctata]|uniref:Glutamyl-tRNA(Gln) amidotransferase subunit B, mitochondrial n=1 Tax=Henosepilachna vigintioctopunctata TaxID=420089 RepID=A0AAW1UBX2_9CUCU
MTEAKILRKMTGGRLEMEDQASSSSFLSSTNTNVSFHDASIPGTLPVLNKRCVEAGVITALALDCNVNMISMFDRKHYFYGDMPAGYQITQQRHPLASDGSCKFIVFTPGIHKSPYMKEVKIKQIQLEQDSGKSLHCDDRSLVDLNRAGMGLMELVFHPDLSDGEEAAALVKELCRILKRVETCSCKMEEGALRVDVNVSIHRCNEPLGIRTEIKNIGSVRAVAAAVKYEIERQIKLKNKGYDVINETRAWDAEKKITVAMRDKEEKQDYRYMPEPNLSPLFLSTGDVHQGLIDIEQLKQSLPELPAKTRERLEKTLELTADQAMILVNDDVLLTFFEDCVKKKELIPKFLAKTLIYEFSNAVNKMNIDPANFLHRIDFVADTVYLMQTRQINRDTALNLFIELLQGNTGDPLQIVTKKNLFQITDEAELELLCKELMNENKKLVDLYRGGKTKVLKAMMGILAAKTNQRADMAKCDQILKKLLNE